VYVSTGRPEFLPVTVNCAHFREPYVWAGRVQVYVYMLVVSAATASFQHATQTYVASGGVPPDLTGC
jgi:hypothetical protein